MTQWGYNPNAKPLPRDANESDVLTYVGGAWVAQAAAGGAPSGLIAMWSGTLANIPSGWVLCDGTAGTPDLRDRFIKSVGAAEEPGGTGGASTHTHAAHAALVHSGTAVAAHPILTHSGVTVGDHASHTHTYSQIVNHTHTISISDPTHAHTQRYFPTATGGSIGYTVDTSMSGTQTNTTLTTTSAATGITATSANPAGGVAQGTTDGPSAVLSHVVTQPADHAAQTHDTVNHEPLFFKLAFIMKT